MRISLGTKFQLTPTVLISFLQNLPKKFCKKIFWANFVKKFYPKLCSEEEHIAPKKQSFFEKKVFLYISQISQENIYAGVSF